MDQVHAFYYKEQKQVCHGKICDDDFGIHWYGFVPVDIVKKPHRFPFRGKSWMRFSFSFVHQYKFHHFMLLTDFK